MALKKYCIVLVNVRKKKSWTTSKLKFAKSDLNEPKNKVMAEVFSQVLHRFRLTVADQHLFAKGNP